MKKQIKAVINEFLYRMRFPRKSTIEETRVSRLRKEILSLPEIIIDPASSAATKAWLKNRVELRRQIVWRDPRNFLQWDVVQRTMFHECKQIELEFLKKLSNWENLRKYLVEDSIGNPKKFVFMSESSGNLIHHIYSVERFLGTHPVSVQNMSQVVEFGGGYGSMARLFYKMGFNGRYVIFDVPEFAALQEFFLSSLDISIPIFRYPTRERGIVILTEAEDFKRQCAFEKIDLFIATWSISESSLGLREIILKSVESADYWLVAYQKRFQDIDNIDYFKKYMDTSQREWRGFEIEHLPGQYYAFGAKK